MSDNLTQGELNHLEALLAAASPGPWNFEPHGDGDALFAGPSEINGMPVHRLNILNYHPLIWDSNGENNRALIEAMHHTLPALIKIARQRIE